MTTTSVPYTHGTDTLDAWMASKGVFTSAVDSSKKGLVEALKIALRHHCDTNPYYGCHETKSFLVSRSGRCSKS